ncbi:hypothetical protein C8Q80DRAFT_1266049 [Daedaleopsis nitida]|nr:hypothetical protein C8Q80DRAFT_1266049 [Daedaleopsis nitida]
MLAVSAPQPLKYLHLAISNVRQQQQQPLCPHARWLYRNPPATIAIRDDLDSDRYLPRTNEPPQKTRFPNGELNRNDTHCNPDLRCISPTALSAHPTVHHSPSALCNPVPAVASIAVTTAPLTPAPPAVRTPSVGPANPFKLRFAGSTLRQDSREGRLKFTKAFDDIQDRDTAHYVWDATSELDDHAPGNAGSIIRAAPRALAARICPLLVARRSSSDADEPVREDGSSCLCSGPTSAAVFRSTSCRLRAPRSMSHLDLDLDLGLGLNR